MEKQIVAQIELDVARNSNHNPARQKLKDTVNRGHRQQEQGVSGQLLPGDAKLQVVHGAANHLGKQDPNAVVEENAGRPQGVTPTIALDVG